ncbi:nitrous oxide reductase accessory protein NosL [Desulfurivibrio alkaliphilus]|uniref:Twin-arginine translocation pathway signal protein n=1 Tax=Desulfurivibrio alkaliphilus (strain DSM 19089 / UNIQEM U267 / AHT2) TaxID=589865 RepID=D6Z1J0_DESAT|nr:nitrous oxide reductase accessory protein NosL [Desulfurivibrio alkaliphilus]ADH87324.1 conserved hypothetical protein [Desulfurivibrio alkaliphilus AHT 2]
MVQVKETENLSGELQAGFSRRQAIKAMGIAALAGAALLRPASARAMDTDGTPMQFMPKTKPDVNPLENELAKYAKCPYCGMDRKQWHHSRHLIHYDDDLVDATCSLRCAAISLSLNIDRGPRAIYAADFGSQAEVKPLVEVDKATYLIGSDLPGTMSRNSKMAFASKEAAQAARVEHGGKLGDFDQALLQAYQDQAEDTVMIRQRRAQRRKMMEQNGHGHGHGHN